MEVAFSEEKLFLREVLKLLGRSAPVGRKVLSNLTKKGMLEKTTLSCTDTKQYYSLADNYDE